MLFLTTLNARAGWPQALAAKPGSGVDLSEAFRQRVTKGALRG